MATHSSVLAWRIPWTEKPGRLQSMASHRVGHDWSDTATANQSIDCHFEYILLVIISPSHRVCSNSCLLSWWCHPTISSYLSLKTFANMIKVVFPCLNLHSLIITEVDFQVFKMIFIMYVGHLYYSQLILCPSPIFLLDCSSFYWFVGTIYILSLSHYKRFLNSLKSLLFLVNCSLF